MIRFLSSGVPLPHLLVQFLHAFCIFLAIEKWAFGSGCPYFGPHRLQTEKKQPPGLDQLRGFMVRDTIGHILIRILTILCRFLDEWLYLGIPVVFELLILDSLA